MKKKVRCPYCGKNRVIRKGFRPLITGQRQIYKCKTCRRKFSFGFGKKRFSGRFVLDAVFTYNQGYSFEDSCNIIRRKHKEDASISSVHRWVREYDLGYLAIRERILRRCGCPVIYGKPFKHSGLIYHFKYHKGKLNEFGKYPRLKDYISSMRNIIRDEYFDESNGRCSKPQRYVAAEIREEENRAMAGILGGVLATVSNRQRHAAVENLMLHCDRNTVAIEVPVWYWDKQQGRGICGHIDLLQVKFGKVWILDYKPHAEKENPGKTAAQLYNYALGLSFRTRIKLSEIRCGWFDEKKTYIFDADKAKPI